MSLKEYKSSALYYINYETNDATICDWQRKASAALKLYEQKVKVVERKFGKEIAISMQKEIANNRVFNSDVNKHVEIENDLVGEWIAKITITEGLEAYLDDHELSKNGVMGRIFFSDGKGSLHKRIYDLDFRMSKLIPLIKDLEEREGIK